MLNNIGLPGLLLIAVVVLVLFGRGKIDQAESAADGAAEAAKDVTPSDKDKA